MRDEFILPDDFHHGRFWAKVDKAGGDDACWFWRGYVMPNGYGHACIGHQKLRYAHRVAYALAHGSVPAGLDVDHLCFARSCVNPAHLDAVTHAENVRRSTTRPGSTVGVNLVNANTNRTHCSKGHPFDEANTYRWPGNPRHRYCRTCNTERARGYRDATRGGWFTPFEGRI